MISAATRDVTETDASLTEGDVAQATSSHTTAPGLIRATCDTALRIELGIW